MCWPLWQLEMRHNLRKSPKISITKLAKVELENHKFNTLEQRAMSKGKNYPLYFGFQICYDIILVLPFDTITSFGHER